MRISDWSSDVCSSDLSASRTRPDNHSEKKQRRDGSRQKLLRRFPHGTNAPPPLAGEDGRGEPPPPRCFRSSSVGRNRRRRFSRMQTCQIPLRGFRPTECFPRTRPTSEAHTSPPHPLPPTSHPLLRSHPTPPHPP